MARANVRDISSGNAPAPDTASFSVPRSPLRTDTLIAVGLALAVIATRFPVRSRRVFNWDAVNFVLALSHYDVRLHRPHPPGYPLFVAMGKLLSFVIPDANGALVAAAMLLSAGAVAALFWLGKTLFDRATGIIAALFLLFSVTFWTNGAVALAYPSLALFSTLAALFAWQLRHAPQATSYDARHASTAITPLAARSVKYSALLSVAYALGAGFRPDLLLFLAPLWLWGHGKAGWRQTLTGALIVAAIRACWAIPMVALSGGVGEYLKVFQAYTATDVLKRYSVAANGPRALLVNLRDTATYTGYALYALALPVAGAAVWLPIRARQWHQPIVALFALWIAPMLLFYTWVHIGDPGYVFTFVPALLLIAARFTTWATRVVTGKTHQAGSQAHTSTAGRFALIVLTTCSLFLVVFPLAANSAIFLKRPLALTAPGIRQQDRTIDDKIAYVRAHGNPATTLLVSYESYRHWLLYLPDYRTQFVDVTYGTEADRTLSIPPGMTQIILMDDTLIRAAQGITPTDTATFERDRVATLAAPAVPLSFAPLASPLGAPRV